MRGFAKPIFAFLVLFALCAVGGFAHAQEEGNALVTPSIFVRSVTADTVQAEPGGVIEGSFVVANEESRAVSSLSYGVELLKMRDEGGRRFSMQNLSVIDTWHSDQQITFPPNKKEELPFTYDIPKHIPSGHYVARVFIKNPEFMPFAWDWYEVGYMNGGGEPWVRIGDVSIEVQGESYGRHVGVPVAEGDRPRLRFLVRNTQDTALEELSYGVTIHEAYDSGPVRRTLQGTLEKSVPPHASQMFSVRLPAMDDPGIHWSEIALHTGGERVSSFVSFHWVTPGAYARVLDAGMQQSAFRAGDTAQATFVLAGRPDTHLASNTQMIGALDVTLEVQCEEGVIGAKTVTRTPDPETRNTFRASVPIERSGSECRLALTTKKNGATLHTYESRGVSPDTVRAQRDADMSGLGWFNTLWQRWWVQTGISVIVLFIIGMFLYSLYHRFSDDEEHEEGSEDMREM